MRALSSRKASIVPLLGLVALLPPRAARAEPAAAPPACFVAFVHGSTATPALADAPQDGAAARAYWEIEGRAGSSLPLAVGDGGACVTWAVAYDGTKDWAAESPRVAASLNAFVDRSRIPDGALVLVGHSMGGLVVRFILDNGEPNAPYFNHGGADFARLRAKTRHAITLQAPHMGSEAADALFGEASTVGGRLTGLVARWYGGHEATPARRSMRKGYMEDAARWMGDEGRTRTIWTLAGTSTRGPGSSWVDAPGIVATPAEADVRADDVDAWRASVALDLEGAFPNDGLVEAASAHGRSIEKGWTWGLRWPPWRLDYEEPERAMKGAHEPWVSTPLNHNHGRYSALPTSFVDARTGGEARMTLGEKLRAHGLALPCSDPQVRAGLPTSCP